MTQPSPIILVVEDEPRMRRFLRTALEVQDFRIVEAETAKDALVAATTHNPEVILLDLGLPDGDGIDLARRIREWSRVPIIVISARGREADKVAVLDAGAAPAPPGEFTRRAFLNNKMDLVQAEAVAHLIHADSDQAYRIALDHLQGTLSQRYTLLKEKLTSLLCGIEAAIDFPEEEVPLFNPASGKKELAFIKGIISAMIASYQTGKKIAQGVRVAIIGPPNAGKSSLFNALCEKERVIVHEHPGTTRDTVEETITIEGMKITLIDTAGIWKSSNPVEARGIARAKDAAKRADLSLVVFDAGKPCAKNEAGLFSAISTSERIVVCNKADLKHVRTCHGLLVSAKTGQGITRLKKMIMSRIVARTSDGAQEILVSERQRDILTAMAAHIDSCMSLAKNQGGEELYAFELRQALNLLGRITGDVSDDDILNTIFNTFCIGK